MFSFPISLIEAVPITIYGLGLRDVNYAGLHGRRRGGRGRSDCGLPFVFDMDSAGMRRLIDSRELRERLGVAGRELANRCYGKAAFRQRLEDFYQNIAA